MYAQKEKQKARRRESRLLVRRSTKSCDDMSVDAFRACLRPSSMRLRASQHARTGGTGTQAPRDAVEQDARADAVRK